MDKGRAEIIVDRMIETVENASSVPLAIGKVAINKEEFMSMLKNLQDLMTVEMKVYRDVTEKRAKIISDAKKEADEIIFQAENSASRIRVNKRRDTGIPYLRDEELTTEEKKSLKTAGDIYASSLIFTDEMLTEVDNVLHTALDSMEQEYSRMMNTIKSKIKAISNNKNEVMSSLNELTKQDRYAQILELSELLSNEIYHEREKAKLKAEAEKEKEMSAASISEDYDSEYDSAFDIPKEES